MGNSGEAEVSSIPSISSPDWENEKGEKHAHTHVVDEDAVRNGSVADVDMSEVVVPHDDAEFIVSSLVSAPCGTHADE